MKTFLFIEHRRSVSETVLTNLSGVSSGQIIMEDIDFKK